MFEELAQQLKNTIEGDQAEMVEFLEKLVTFESPTSEPDTQAQILSYLLQELESLDLTVRHVPGLDSGGYLIAEPADTVSFQGRQLLIGHCDTVWPIGTIKTMPFSINNNIAMGPGVFDMKSGLTQIVFALRAIRKIGQSYSIAPLVFINSDEETGSRESKSSIVELAQQVERAYILEPALGLNGKLKTERKGVGRFTIFVEGRAAHAGLAPEKGSSAVLELSHIIQKLFSLSDPVRGISVNVGKIEGGLQPNVIAPSSKAEIDVRVPSSADALFIEKEIFNMETTTPGTRLQVNGGIERPPLEKTPANAKLWKLAQRLAGTMDLNLEEGLAGGGSDGNYTSQFTATIDGLGAVGDGAHAQHEFIYIDKMIERTILLALLVMAPSVEQ